MSVIDKQNSPSTHFIIDTNAIIQILTEIDIKKRIQEFLKGKKCKIVVCREIFSELSKSKPISHSQWRGIDKKTVIKKISDVIGDRVFDYLTSEKVICMAKNLEKKHTANGLHYPDSVLLAIAKTESWPNIISADGDLAMCCELEKIMCHNQNLLKSKPKKIEEISQSKVMSKLQSKDYSLNEIEPEVLWLFKNLCEKFDQINYLDREKTKRLFSMALASAVKILKSREPIFGRLEGHNTDSPFMIGFFSKIRDGVDSYSQLISLLMTKSEIKEHNIKNLQDLIDT